MVSRILVPLDLTALGEAKLPVAQEYAPGLQADKHGIIEPEVIFQYLVRQSFNRKGKLLFGKDRLQTPDF